VGGVSSGLGAVGGRSNAVGAAGENAEIFSPARSLLA
jgi:hypothetical protein